MHQGSVVDPNGCNSMKVVECLMPFARVLQYGQGAGHTGGGAGGPKVLLSLKLSTCVQSMQSPFEKVHLELEIVWN